MSLSLLCNQVEDIIDSGHTLARLSTVLKDAGADTVKVVALLDKKGRRRVEFFPDYVGWEVSSSSRRRGDASALATHIEHDTLLPCDCLIPISAARQVAVAGFTHKTNTQPDPCGVPCRAVYMCAAAAASPLLFLQCPNAFIVGYGLDYNESFRCLPYLAELKEEAYADSAGH